ncbi:hypothetical protein [Christiangramia forsetii]|uniref:Secreted protein n=2 Tax=Christiangramia forsetii TaxID=411153 RepID=A0M5B4_CHRFK|nr:hypothetical protein [Christiangramia forsetii]GGG21381.1 hypothetical protein GCM10011532_00490 [Christiangramia forsetii]CAL67809.1 secreted protein [Christiangramia forsetii KT0803]
MKTLLTGIFIFGFVIMASAQDLNNYKYIIVPESFEFTDEVDQYRLNSLTKFLFEKYGFNTVMKTEDKPEDLRNNPCLGLNTNVVNNSSLFVTKLTLQLIDCGNNVVFETREGTTREKDFKTAYHEALRDAFSSVEEVDYNYVENTNIARESSEKEVAAAPVPVKEPVVEKSAVKDSVETEEDEIIEEEPEVAVEVEKKENGQGEYSYSGKNYSLKETPQGLGLFQENSSDPIAILIKTSGGKSYIYNSLTNQGVAYFDKNANLIVEYFNKQEDKMVVLTYELND